MWSAISLSCCKSCCRLRSGCLSWLLLLLGLILLVSYPLQLTFRSSVLWLLLPPPLVEYGDALYLVFADRQVLLGPHKSYSWKGLSRTVHLLRIIIIVLLCETLPRLVLYDCRFPLLLCCQVLDYLVCFLAVILSEACFHFLTFTLYPCLLPSSSLSWSFFESVDSLWLLLALRSFSSGLVFGHKYQRYQA